MDDHFFHHSDPSACLELAAIADNKDFHMLARIILGLTFEEVEL